MTRIDEKTQNREAVVIIGAGPPGVAAAVGLSDLGIHSLLIDREKQVASTWHGRYDRLRLDTNKWFSRLPGRPYQRRTPIFPTRDQVANYYERHAQAPGVRQRLDTLAERVDPVEAGGWRVQTPDGVIYARHVIVATGRARLPVLPSWPGLDTFTGDFLHSSAYLNATPYVGARVLVVGSGASGLDIAHDLARGGAAEVSLAVRTPPNILLRSVLGFIPGDVLLRPLFHLRPRTADRILRCLRLLTVGDLTGVGLPLPAEGAFAAAHRRAISPSIVDKDVIRALRRGEIKVVANVTTVDTSEVSLVDGSRLEPDVIVAATGYQSGLDPLVGHLDVLDDTGSPRLMAPEPAIDGLWFIGYQLGPTSLGIAGRQSRPLARRIAEDIARQHNSAGPVGTEGSKW